MPPHALPTPSEMIAYLDRFVYGQAAAKRALATSVYNHYLGLAYPRETPGSSPFGKNHLLLLGPTGVGKSYMVMTLARFLGVPFAFGNAKSLVEVGFVGQQVDSLLRSLLLAGNNDVRKAQRGIIFVDEIDKIRKAEMAERDISGEGVQTSLLALLDGRPIPVRITNDATREIDTSDILFIGAGAFVGLAEIVHSRAGGGRLMGFNSQAASNTEMDDDAALHSVLPEDLEEYGFIPELIGRFPVIAALDQLKPEELVRLLQEAEESILKRQQRLFEVHGIDLQFTPGALEAVARRTVEAGTGVRGMERVLLSALDPVDWRLPELAQDGVVRVVITEDTVLAGGPPEQVKGSFLAAERRHMAEGLRRIAFEFTRPGSQPLLSDRVVIAGITNTQGMGEDIIRNLINMNLAEIGWDTTEGAARDWWLEFERINQGRPALILRMTEELRNRKATISEFYFAYVYSMIENLQGILHFLDYDRIRRKEGELARNKKPKDGDDFPPVSRPPEGREPGKKGKKPPPSNE